MDNEVRYYLKKLQEAIKSEEEPFVPQLMVTAVRLPTGFIEVAVNHNSVNIIEKIDYILKSYDQDMRLLTNTDIIMENVMIV